VNTKKEKLFKISVLDFLGKEAWGIDLGRAAMEKMEKMLRDRPEKIVNLDLRGVERMDASCSREALANLVRRQRGERCFFLSGVSNQSVRENIDTAFARQEMTILLRHGDDYDLIGHPLRSHLLQTLGVVEELGTATARQVSDAIKDLALTACNNRLRDLCDVGLLLRADGTAASGGKEFAYVAVR
jgi:anti-anti-sigma regulatory factor